MLVIAHRGASSYAPENTAAAFDMALELGAGGIETDIRASKDGRLVLLHDADVERTSDGRGPVSELSFDELRRLDFGRWFDDRFSGESIPSLEEFLERYAGKIHLTLELKADGTETGVSRAVNDSGLDYSGWVVTSFSPARILKFLQVAPGAPAGLLTQSLSEDKLRFCLDNGISSVCPRSTGLAPESVARARSLGLFVRAWGVPDVETMKRAALCGVDGMTVNFPDKLIEYIRSGFSPESFS